MYSLVSCGLRKLQIQANITVDPAYLLTSGPGIALRGLWDWMFLNRWRIQSIHPRFNPHYPVRLPNPSFIHSPNTLIISLMISDSY